MSDVVIQTSIPRYPCRRGKVRDVYDLGETLLIVACDRISAFDVVLPDAIPEKGRVLTRLSRFWFERLSAASPNHLIEVLEESMPSGLQEYAAMLRGRSMLCRKCEVVPIECVVRGYLAGSGWADYRRSGAVCGITLPQGLQKGQQLPEPIFTPSTKADVGHDENITFEQAAATAGRDVMEQLKQRSIACYAEAAELARSRGVIIADTKFEWGLDRGELVLIDEVLTPDSSRFWPADGYEPGSEPDSFDKQYVRNHLQELVDRGAWNRESPAPALPAEVIHNTTAKYIEAFERITEQSYPAVGATGRM